MASKKSAGERKMTGKKKGRLKDLPRKKPRVSQAQADAIKGGYHWLKTPGV